MGTAESGISTNKTNIASLTTDLSDLTSRVSTAEETIKEHTDAIELNANNIAANIKSIATNATAITAVSNRVQRFEDVIGIDANGDVYIKGLRNFYTEGGTIGMAGLGSGGSGGGGGTAGLGSVTVRVNGQDYITDASGIVTIPSYPTSLPASDVYAWAKAATKPTYTASEVGALSVSGGTVTGDFGVKNTYGGILIKNSQNGNNGYIVYEGGTSWAVTDNNWYNTYQIYHTGNFNPANYLPLSGGTLSGDITLGDTYNSAWKAINFNRNGTSAFIGINSGNELEAGFHNGYLKVSGASFNYVTPNGVHTVIHSGNYSSYALPLSGGTIGNPLTIASSSDNKIILNETGSDVKYQYIEFQNQGVRYGILGTFGDDDIKWNNKTIIHSGNYSDYALPLSGGTIKGSGNYASTPLCVESTNISYVGVALKAGTRGDVGALRYYEALGVGLINVETNAEIAVSDIPYFTTDAGATRYAIPTLNRDNSLSIQTTSMSRYLNFGSAPFSWSGSYTYPLIWSSADKENTGDVWVMIAMPHIPYLEKDKRGYTGTTWGARIRFEANTTSNVVWDIGTASDDTFSIVRDGNYVFNIFGGGNAAYGGTVEISKYSWDGTLVVGKDGKDKAVIGYCGSSTNGVVFGGHNSGLSQWAPVNVSGSAVYLRYNENIVLDVTNARVGITGNLAVSGGATFGGDVYSEGTMAMAKLASSSDRKLKDNIAEVSAEQSMSIIRQLKPTTWNWKKDGKKSYGFIAQEVEPIVPEMVVDMGHLHLEYNQLHAFEIGAIQHIDSEVDKLKKDLAIANGRIEVLENELKQYRRA
jgi:hypothetical protein